MRYFMSFACAILLFPTIGFAQLSGTDVAPGDVCTAAQANRVMLTADADGDRKGVVLICDGTNWVVEQPTIGSTCSNGDSIVYDASTGGLSCGVPDTTAPIWITPAGTLATVDVNLSINETVAASDESGTPTYQKTAGAGWINVASNGTVSGKAPASGGTYLFTVRARDGSGNTADRNFNIIVNAGSGPTTCVNPGDTCSDGTVYAGASPDDGEDFFVRPANYPPDLPFNDGSTNYINTSLADCSGTISTCRTGESNTIALMTQDASSEPGFQYHRAARACYCLGEEHANAPDSNIPPECAGDPENTNTLDGHGHDDWYLPSIAELDVMYVNLRCPGDPNNPAWVDGITNSEGASGCPSFDGALAS